nr:MAG TPA: hypothetical protein [Caudoviricetes sp.]
MKLKYLDKLPDGVQKWKTRKTKIRELLEEFSKSDFPCCKVIPEKYEYSGSTSIQSSIITSISRAGYKMRCIKHGEEVYIFKTDVYELGDE